jgi:putative salt-induced outer membrane protein YdiY
MGGTEMFRIARIFVVVSVSLLSVVQSAVAQNGAKNLNQFSAPPPAKAAPNACAEPVKDPSIWDKSVLFGLNYTDGNTNTTNINFGGKASRDFENNAWLFQADYNYGAASTSAQEPRTENTNNVRGLATYRRVLENDWFTGAGTSFAHDEIADLKYRAIVSPSIGKYLVREDDANISLEVGPSYIWEKLGDLNEDYAAARIADRFEYAFTPTAKVYQFFEYLIAFDDASQYIFNAEVGLESALNSYLSLVLTVRDYYINEPAQGRVPNDIMTITALKISL